ncbi:PTS trehalose transporter subunit IIC [Clostridium sp. AF18-27]|uniref:PTS transporter subunit EIIC n=2 Tax=Enterocloster lavalensis TaxID=460384 RepID=UPI000E4692A5|nr:PTS transporter subunit EIIC [Enterocloster lavalensis]MBS5604626.1 PTS transporter subunit EIIC [Enterocloster asparagiformis]MCB6345129.1 PTS transporter subunit EIIC [Enterocloster lavalensis]RHR53473.1 PTS trehalose transporter subunit IIC [Clostridium sp. AF18-27]
MSTKKSSWKDSIQTFGRSLLLPIALLAPIGMVMGICSAMGQSYMIEKFPFLGNEILKLVLSSLQTITSIVFNNIPLLFAMGVAQGMAKNEKGIAVFSSAVGYLTLNVVMSVYLKATGTMADAAVAAQVGQGTVLGIQTLKIEALGGLISGLVAAKVADRFYRLELPLAFAFFGGKKSIPIITFVCMIPIGLVIPVIWNVLTSFLISISFIFTAPYVGNAVYYTLNRALIPFGLHHVLASLVRFTEAGGTYMINGTEYVGILNATNEILFNLGPTSEYWKQLMPTLTSYLGGAQMLTTLFRVPAIGLAMYHTSFLKNRKIAKGVILTCCLTAFLGNITEPLEFSFLFISPPLFILYCVMCGIGAIPYQMLNICIGYIRGTIFDFGIFGLLYEDTQWISLVILGIINFVVFYFVFKWFIVKFNLETPGREAFEIEESASVLLKEKNWPAIAAIVIEGLGGKENIVNVENCISRLRVDLKDPNKVDQIKIKDSGCAGIFFPSTNHIHVVFGPHVEFVRHAVDDSLKK